MDHFDPYNVLLAIATNIPVLLMTAFVLQSHVYQQHYECYKTISLLFLLLLVVSVIYSSRVVWVNPSLHSYYTLTAHLCLFSSSASSSPSTSTCAGVQQKATWIPSIWVYLLCSLNVHEGSCYLSAVSVVYFYSSSAHGTQSVTRLQKWV